MGQPATEFTLAANSAIVDKLPFGDTADFDFADRGLIGTRAEPEIVDASGRVVWNLSDYDFVRNGECPDTVNPSLWRQGQLNARHGLFEVAENVYQVRGFDVSNVSFIAGESGWIVVDPLTSTECATAALELVTEHLGERPIKAVIYSHSHVDHFGGVRGIVTDDDVAKGTQIIAPEGFFHAAVAENVYAGTAMARRANYQFGNLLPKDPHGDVDSGIGKYISTGTVSLMRPTVTVDTTGHEMVVDGVRIVFQNAPNSEAPSEFNFSFPDLGALCMAETCTAVMHNLYTLRGAKVRDSLRSPRRSSSPTASATRSTTAATTAASSTTPRRSIRTIWAGSMPTRRISIRTRPKEPGSATSTPSADPMRLCPRPAKPSTPATTAGLPSS